MKAGARTIGSRNCAAGGAVTRLTLYHRFPLPSFARARADESRAKLFRSPSFHSSLLSNILWTRPEFEISPCILSRGVEEELERSRKKSEEIERIVGKSMAFRNEFHYLFCLLLLLLLLYFASDVMVSRGKRRGNDIFPSERTIRRVFKLRRLSKSNRFFTIFFTIRDHSTN